jgi:hypothetical protein
MAIAGVFLLSNRQDPMGPTATNSRSSFLSRGFSGRACSIRSMSVACMTCPERPICPGRCGSSLSLPSGMELHMGINKVKILVNGGYRFVEPNSVVGKFPHARSGNRSCFCVGDKLSIADLSAGRSAKDNKAFGNSLARDSLEIGNTL